MADKTTGDLQAVPVGDLPLAPDIYDDTLIPVEQNGEAKHMTGAQWKAYGVAAAKEEADRAKVSAQASATSETNAAKSATNAKTSENNSAVSERNAKASETAALEAANRAEQAAVANGFAEFDIDEDGHLYLTRTTNLEESLDFELVDGRLEVIVA